MPAYSTDNGFTGSMAQPSGYHAPSVNAAAQAAANRYNSGQSGSSTASALSAAHNASDMRAAQERNDRAAAEARAQAAAHQSAVNAAASYAREAPANVRAGTFAQAPQSQAPSAPARLTASTALTSPVSFSQAQFGRQRYAPGQMFSNPATQAPALRSVVNGIQLMGGTPQQQLNALYSNMGYNPAARAGMIGAFGVESANFDPKVLDGTRRGDNGTAYGIGQWRDYTNPNTGETDPRATNARGYVSDMGLPSNSLLGQGAFGGTELANKYGASFAAAQRATTPTQAAEAMIGYEKPGGYTSYLKTGDPSVVAGWNRRVVGANAAFTTPTLAHILPSQVSQASYTPTVAAPRPAPKPTVPNYSPGNPRSAIAQVAPYSNPVPSTGIRLSDVPDIPNPATYAPNFDRRFEQMNGATTQQLGADARQPTGYSAPPSSPQGPNLSDLFGFTGNRPGLGPREVAPAFKTDGAYTNIQADPTGSNYSALKTAYELTTPRPNNIGSIVGGVTPAQMGPLSSGLKTITDRVTPASSKPNPWTSQFGTGVRPAMRDLVDSIIQRAHTSGAQVPQVVSGDPQPDTNPLYGGDSTIQQKIAGDLEKKFETYADPIKALGDKINTALGGSPYNDLYGNKNLKDPNQRDRSNTEHTKDQKNKKKTEDGTDSAVPKDANASITAALALLSNPGKLGLSSSSKDKGRGPKKPTTPQDANAAIMAALAALSMVKTGSLKTNKNATSFA